MTTKRTLWRTVLLLLALSSTAPSSAAAEILFLPEHAFVDANGGKAILLMRYEGDTDYSRYARVIYDIPSGAFQFVSSNQISFITTDLYSSTINEFRFVYGRAHAYKLNGGGFRSFSDGRVKKDVRDFRHGLAEIEKLWPVTFRYNGRASLAPDDGTDYIGLIAQDVQKILPFMVDESDTDKVDGKPVLTLDPSALTYVLANAVKEETRMLENVEKRLANLERAVCAARAQARNCK
jgi:hypothetical protein